MSQNERVTFTTPVGRLVAGSLYDANDTDLEGRPLTIKNGPNAGQPRVEYYFALAIPKSPQDNGHWANTDWGRKIWEAGHRAFPQGQAQQPTFAWKVTDGDSTVPNGKGRRPCDREGWAGHWVLHFSGGYAPRIFNADGTQAIVEPNAVKLGYWVQVFGNVSGNGSPLKPGVHLNHSLVALAAYGTEIVVGPDAAAVGFGQGVTLPPGASAAPVGGAFNPAPPAAPGIPAPAAAPAPMAPPMPGAQGVAPAPGIPPHPGTPAAGIPSSAAPAAPAMMPSAAQPPAPAPLPAAAPAVSPGSVQPHPGFITPPAAPAAPAAAAGPTMTAAAGGIPYESYIAQGWTDAQLRERGLML